MRDIEGFRVLGDVCPNPVATVVTESSVWLVDHATYTRLPKNEDPDFGCAHEWDGERMQRGKRHLLLGALWVVEEPSELLRMRILPVAGSAGGYGIVTGVVVAARGVAVGDPGRRRLESRG